MSDLIKATPAQVYQFSQFTKIIDSVIKAGLPENQREAPAATFNPRDIALGHYATQLIGDNRFETDGMYDLNPKPVRAIFHDGRRESGDRIHAWSNEALSDAHCGGGLVSIIIPTEASAAKTFHPGDRTTRYERQDVPPMHWILRVDGGVVPRYFGMPPAMFMDTYHAI